MLSPQGVGHNNIIPVVPFLKDPDSLLAAFLGPALNGAGDLVKTPRAGQKSPWAR